MFYANGGPAYILSDTYNGKPEWKLNKMILAMQFSRY
jgi:hypothetical protein